MLTRTVTALAWLLALAAPVAAIADPAGTTLLQSRPSGLAPLPAPSGGDAQTDPGSRTVSANSCRVVFSSTDDGLMAGDDDRGRNTYVRDLCFGTIELVGPINPMQGGGLLGVSGAISPNGRYVAFVSDRDLGGDPPENSQAVYLRDLDADTTTLVSTGAVVHPQQGLTVTDEGLVAFRTPTGLSDQDTNGTQDAYVGDGAETPALASRTPDGGAAGGVTAATLSEDGRAIGFVTTASLDDADANTGPDVYVRELGSGHVALVSRADGADGAATGDSTGAFALNGDGTVAAFTTRVPLAGESGTAEDVYVRSGASTELVSRAGGPDGAAVGGTAPSLDAGGAFVAFESTADDVTQILVRHRTLRPTTTVVSRVGEAGAPGDASSRRPALSSDGGHVVFQTAARNLGPQPAGDFTRVLRRRLGDAVTSLASSPAGDATGFATPANAAIASQNGRQVSANGRFVVFTSHADGLSDADDDRVTNVFVRDNVEDTTTLVNRTVSGGPDTKGANEPQISDNGQKIVFLSSDRLDPVHDTDAFADVYVRDRVAGTTTLASRPSGADADGLADLLRTPAISADGSRVAFVGTLDYAPGDGNGTADVYVRDLDAGTTELASRRTGEHGAPLGEVQDPVLSNDGNRVAFSTTAFADTTHDVNGMTDIYRRDLAAAETVLVSRIDGAGTASGDGMSVDPAMSGDGNRIAFVTSSTNLGAGHTSARSSVHLRDVVAGRTYLVSRGTGADGPSADNRASQPAVSQDGTKVAFAATAGNLGGGGPAGIQQVYLRDLDGATTALVSRVHGADGAPATGHSGQPSLSADGACVGFSTQAPTLAPAVAPAGDFTQYYVRAVGGECGDEAPDTQITGGPDGPTADTTPTFTFASPDDAQAGFACRVDDGAWELCASPLTLGPLVLGTHTLQVRAIDAGGHTDATPAERTFTVRAPDREPPGDEKDPKDGPKPTPPAPGAPAPGPAPAPPAGPRGGSAPSTAPAVRLAQRTIRVRTGRATLTLTCSAGTCRGTAVLTAKLGRRTVTLGRRSYAIRAGKLARITVTLPASARRALRGGRRLKATVALGGGQTTTVTLR